MIFKLSFQSSSIDKVKKSELEINHGERSVRGALWLAFRRDGGVVSEGLISVETETTAGKRPEQSAPVRAVESVLVSLDPSITSRKD